MGGRAPEQEDYKPITPTQSAYLRAFDAHLRARTDQELCETQNLMSACLHDMALEAGLITALKSNLPVKGRRYYPSKTINELAA